MAREEGEEEGKKQNIFLPRWLHIKAQQKERVRDKEAERGREVGGDVTFHLTTVATLDASGKLPLCVPFDARHACTIVCDC